MSTRENLIPVGWYTKPEVARLYGVTTRTIDTWWKLGRIPKPIGHRSRNKSRNQRQWSKAEVDADLDLKGLLPSPAMATSSKLEKVAWVLATRLQGKELQLNG